MLRLGRPNSSVTTRIWKPRSSVCRTARCGAWKRNNVSPLRHQSLCLLFLYSTDFHFAEGLPSVCSLNRPLPYTPTRTHPSDYGYSYAVSGVKLEPSRYIAVGRLLLSRPVRARAAVLWTHFLFEVNHVEVYNNIKFPFTRFVGSALFLRQKTHSLHPTTAAASIYLLSCVTSTATFFCTECVWFRFFSFSFLVRLIISTIPLVSSPLPTRLNDSSSGFVGTTVHYLCCVCQHLIYLHTAAALRYAHATHPQTTASVYIANSPTCLYLLWSPVHRGTSFKTRPGV